MSTKSQPFKLKEIIFTCSAHDTEDLEKVKQAVLNLTPEELHSKFEILDTILSGHAGNTIHLLELYVKSNRDIKKTLEYLASKIDDLDKEYLYDEFDKRIGEDNCLYLRFNKQDAFKKKITIEEKDNTIKVVIKFVIYKHEPDLIKNTLIEYDILRKG